MTTRSRGRPAFVPTAEQRMRVQIMAGCGLSQAIICEQTINTATGVAIDEKTLRKVFKDELAGGKAYADGLVTQALFKKATGTGPQSVTAAIFWLKARAGWKDKTHVQFDGHLAVEANIKLQEMTDEHLLAIAAGGSAGAAGKA